MKKALYSNVLAIENDEKPLEVSSFFHEFHDFVIASSRKPLYSKLFARVDWLHICLYTCIYVYRRIYAYIGARVDWLHICLHTRIYVYRRIYAYVGARVDLLHICLYIRVYTCIGVYTRIKAYIYAYIYACKNRHRNYNRINDFSMAACNPPRPRGARATGHHIK